MRIPRVIPVLLLKNKGLVKTVKFRDPCYVGDPINAVKIFNEKEVDELIFLDITASSEKREPNYEYLEKISSECFMPFCYGGGIKTISEIRKITNVGVEKVSINTYAFEHPEFIKIAADEFGSSTIVVSIDVKKNIWGKPVVAINNGKNLTKWDPIEYAKKMEEKGAGELLLNSIDRDGIMQGYDIDMIKKVTEAVSIPVIVCGGAKSTLDLKKGADAGASGMAAGSMFVFHGKHRAVLINYPSQKEIKELFK